MPFADRGEMLLPCPLPDAHCSDCPMENSPGNPPHVPRRYRAQGAYGGVYDPCFFPWKECKASSRVHHGGCLQAASPSGCNTALGIEPQQTAQERAAGGRRQDILLLVVFCSLCIAAAFVFLHSRLPNIALCLLAPHCPAAPTQQPLLLPSLQKQPPGRSLAAPGPGRLPAPTTQAALHSSTAQAAGSQQCWQPRFTGSAGASTWAMASGDTGSQGHAAAHSHCAGGGGGGRPSVSERCWRHRHFQPPPPLHRKEGKTAPSSRRVARVTFVGCCAIPAAELLRAVRRDPAQPLHPDDGTGVPT